MRFATEPIWRVTATVLGDAFRWTGHATCAEVARDRCHQSAHRAWSAAIAMCGHVRATTVTGVSEATEEYPKSVCFMRADGLRDALEEDVDPESVPTQDQVMKVLEAVARTEIALYGLPDDLGKLVLGASSGTHLGPKSLVPILRGTTTSSPSERTMALSGEAHAIMEIACVARLAQCVVTGRQLGTTSHGITPSHSHTLRAALRRGADRRLIEDCRLLEDFARRHADQATADSYKAIRTSKGTSAKVA